MYEDINETIQKSCFNTIIQRVQNAIQKLRDEDIALFGVNVNERTISHRLGMYLQDEFPLWHVDCEYNRDFNDPKRLSYDPLCKQISYDNIQSIDIDAKTVYPDIIIHKRQSEKNLLVIEIKKDRHSHRNNQDTKKDIAKLEAFTDTNGNFKYIYGLFLMFGESGDVPDQTWFVNGNLIQKTPHLI